MKRHSRNRILLWVIALGLANFVVYTLTYWYLGGDAPNGGFENGHHFLRGHFIWSGAGKRTDPVSRGIWIYSFIHSITIWPTIAGVLVSMLILARPHIIATMKSDLPLRGMTYVNICILVIIVVTGATTMLFVRDFLSALAQTAAGVAYNV
ncbi:MAG: hypothetical protein HOP29_01710 [Phycisphaerales bacterium]|nr:hypothetical protein [Phycisphaerales bacterium]